jgi:capsular polysaccharide biosynthesis protein
MVRRVRGEVTNSTLDAECMSSPPILPFVTEAAYARWVGVGQQLIYAAETVEAEAPAVFPQPEPGFYDMAPLRYEFPPVTLTTLRDVVVRGKSNILQPPEAIVRHGLIDPAAELNPEVFYGRMELSGDGTAAVWAPADPFNVSYLPEAAVVTDGVAFNYAHWLTEVLPRIAALARHGVHASVPLIVDTDLHPNIMRSIALVAGPEVTIHRLAPDQVVRVGVLHNVSPAGYIPFKLRPKSQGAICQALGEMIASLRRHAGGDGEGEGGRPKLLIRRNSAMRRLVNEEAVAEAMVARGFVVIEPERMSLEEQVALYSRARMVVGATGAAVANLIFCQPDCPTVVIMPKFRETGYWYWRRMAAAVGAGPVFHVSGEQVSRLEDPYHPNALHQDFGVEVKDVLEAVEAAEAFSG